MLFEGVYSIIPTAFTDSGELDPASQRKIVDLFIEKGANGLTALGVTGEVARLEEHERSTILETIVTQANGRVPIIAGTSADWAARMNAVWPVKSTHSSEPSGSR